MKTLTIGNTTLELQSFSKRWDKIGGVYAQIEIPTAAISQPDLKALFTNNQQDLIVTAEDGSTETYSGYAELNGLNEDIPRGVYIVTQYCTATAMHLLNEARKQIDAQGQTIANQQLVIQDQTFALAQQNETITTLEVNDAELLYQVCLLQLGLTEEDL